MTRLVCDARYHTNDAGDLCLTFMPDDGRTASVVASAAALRTLEAELGLPRDAVRAAMLEALKLRIEQGLPAVTIRTPKPSATDASRFASLYFHTAGSLTVADCVWFDVSADLIGPAGVPTEVRIHMRFLVNRMLAPPAARPRLTDALLMWDAAERETASSPTK